MKLTTLSKIKTHDLLLALFNVLLIGFCNNTTQILCQYISYIIKYQIITWLTSDIHLNQSNLSIIWQNTKSSTHHGRMPSRLPLQGCNIMKFYLSTAHTHFSSIPIGCHVAPTNFSACSLVLEFCSSLYIHSDYLLFHIFAFINLTCFLMTKISQYTD